MKVFPTHLLLHGSMVTQNRGPRTISISTQVPTKTLCYRSYVINRALATRLVQWLCHRHTRKKESNHHQESYTDTLTPGLAAAIDCQDPQWHESFSTFHPMVTQNRGPRTIRDNTQAVARQDTHLQRHVDPGTDYPPRSTVTWRFSTFSSMVTQNRGPRTITTPDSCPSRPSVM